MKAKNTRSINDYDELGLTPLLLAVCVGDAEEVRRLLSAGADCNKPQRNETATPLWHAQENFGLMEIAEILKAYGAKLT